VPLPSALQPPPAAAAASSGDGWESLPYELLLRILSRLPLSDRAAAASACVAWRAAAAAPSLWTELSFAGCGPAAAQRLTDFTFRALAARCRGGLTRLDVSALPNISPDAVVAVAKASRASLLELRALDDAQLWTAAHVLQTASACCALRSAEVGARVTSLDAGAALLALAPRGVRVPRLEFRGLVLSPEDAAALGATLRRYTPLRALSLAGCRLGDAPTGFLVGALRGHPTLEALNLSACSIGPGGTTAVAAALQHDALPLRALRLSDNGVFAEGARALGIALRRNRSLASLTLASCGLGVAGGRSIAAALRHNRALRVLDLNGNRLTDEGAAAIAEALAAGAAAGARAAAAARALALAAAAAAADAAEAAERGAALLPLAPPAGAALTTLRLRHNGVGDVGCAALAAVLRLQPSPPLVELDLRLNAARGSGAEALAAALSGNATCTRILLSGNALEPDVAMKLHAAGDGRLHLWDAWSPPRDVAPASASASASAASAAAQEQYAYGMDGAASGGASDMGWDAWATWWDGGAAAAALPAVARDAPAAPPRWQLAALAAAGARARAQLARSERLLKVALAAITLAVGALFIYAYRKSLHAA
jgi:hypothetical protein